jgi:hypothetical protein
MLGRDVTHRARQLDGLLGARSVTAAAPRVLGVIHILLVPFGPLALVAAALVSRADLLSVNAQRGYPCAAAA